MSKLPDTPLLLSGCIGGPTVIYLCTPLRNALTLGAQDSGSSLRLLFRKVFRGGIRAGWTGGVAPAFVACPQFLALSPIYHFLNDHSVEALGLQGAGGHPLVPSLIASFGASMVETLLTFGSQSRNAQMAYNKSFVQFSSLVDGSRKTVRLNKVYSIWGAGAGALALRNLVSAAGMRVVSPWLQEHLPANLVTGNRRATLCDISANLICCPVSAPINQLFNFLVTTPEARDMPMRERVKLARSFLAKQYFVPLPRKVIMMADLSKDVPEQRYSWMLSRVAVRDLAMRSIYISSVFSLFMAIERSLCAAMRPS